MKLDRTLAQQLVDEYGDKYLPKELDPEKEITIRMIQDETDRDHKSAKLFLEQLVEDGVLEYLGETRIHNGRSVRNVWRYVEK